LVVADTVVFRGNLSSNLNLATTLLEIFNLALVSRTPFKRNFPYLTFNLALRLIQGFGDANAPNRGILLLPLVPDSLGKKEDALPIAGAAPLPAAAAEIP
jgi:hypothetical protein